LLAVNSTKYTDLILFLIKVENGKLTWMTGPGAIILFTLEVNKIFIHLFLNFIT
jgi:hypothetical protein